MTRVHVAVAALLAGSSIAVPLAGAAPTPGFVEHFTSTTSGWSSQATVTNPGTGGFGGAGDGFLRIARTGFAAQLGARSTGPEYAGDWIAAQIDQVRMKLKDVDGDQDLEIHLCIGNVNNLWQSNVGFAPPTSEWATFSVDLTDSAGFTQIIAFEPGFAKALRNADRILVRHDRAPYSQAPEAILGEFGLDEIELLMDPPVPARAASWGALKSLYH